MSSSYLSLVPLPSETDASLDRPCSKPGEHFKYGTGIDWLTLVVEKISSLPLEQYFQQNIFA